MPNSVVRHLLNWQVVISQVDPELESFQKECRHVLVVQHVDSRLEGIEETGAVDEHEDDSQNNIITITYISMQINKI